MEKPKAKILIIEDEPAFLEMYQTLFETSGFSVFLALNVDQALEQIASKKPDLILLDIVLGRDEPVKKESLEAGLRLLKEIKQDPKTSRIKVVVLTALGGQYQKEALRLGAEDYIIKTDLLPRQLVKRIEDILSK